MSRKIARIHMTLVDAVFVIAPLWSGFDRNLGGFPGLDTGFANCEPLSERTPVSTDSSNVLMLLLLENAGSPRCWSAVLSLLESPKRSARPQQEQTLRDRRGRLDLLALDQGIARHQAEGLRGIEHGRLPVVSDEIDPPSC